MGWIGSRNLLVRFLAVFGLLILLWQGSLFLALLRPTLVRSGIIPSPIAPLQDGFQYSALGIVAPVTPSPTTSPLETTSWSVIREALTKGVSLAYSSAAFADSRLSFITGHSSDTYPHAYSTVFAALGQSRVDDRFILILNGRQYVYRVVQTQIFSPEDTAAFLALTPKDDQPSRVALVTCWPPMTTNQRFVVLGEQISE